MDCSTPGFPVHHQLLELTQTYVHWVSDAIQPSHLCCPLLLPPSSLVSGSFLKSQLFKSGGQSTGASASTSVLPVNSQDWFPLGWTGWISLQSKGLSRVLSNTTVQKHQFFGAQPSLWSNSHIRALTWWTFVGKVMSLLFNMLSRFVLAFLPRGNCLLISWLQSNSAVNLEPKQIISSCSKTCAILYVHSKSSLNSSLFGSYKYSSGSQE